MRHGFFVGLFSLFFIASPPACAGDWPQFLGPTRNGSSSETGLLSSWPESGPPLIWKKQVGEGFSGPVVVENRVILFHRLGDEEVVECLEAASGKQQWKFAYPTSYHDTYGKGDGPRSTPLVDAGFVYTLGAGGVLHCLELAGGKKVWSRDLHTDYGVRQGFFGVAASPIVEGDVLLINVGGKGAGIVGLAKASGKELWKATDHAASYSSPVAATIDGVRHVFFFTREGLVSVEPGTGTVRFTKPWRARLNASVNAAAPLVVDDRIFLSASYGTGAVLLQVRKDKVEEVWKSDEVLSSHFSSSVVSDGFLYGFDGRQEQGARLRCVEWKTGKVRWTQEAFGCGTIILVEGKLIVLDETGDLVLLEATPEAFREKSRAHLLGKPSRAALALADGRLFARDSEKLICLKMKK